MHVGGVRRMNAGAFGNGERFVFMLDARSPKPAPLLESSDLLRPQVEAQLETISFMEPLEIVDTVARLLNFLFQIQKTTFRSEVRHILATCAFGDSRNQGKGRT